MALEKDTKKTLANKVKQFGYEVFLKDYEILMRSFASDLGKGRTDFQK